MFIIIMVYSLHVEYFFIIDFFKTPRQNFTMVIIDVYDLDVYDFILLREFFID